MVTKRRFQDELDGPPPMDESWWEAVLSEEETQSAPRSTRPTRHAPVAEAREPFSHLDMNGAATLDWRRALELYEQDQVIEMTVTGCNRGGLLVQGERIQGFVPVSHLIEVPCNEADIEPWLEKYVDSALCLKVIECDQERGRVVFSERAAQSMPGSRKQLLSSLRPGGCISGVVTNITDFGVFVDLGGVEGLVHVSEISWGRVHHPGDVFKLGQRVDVYVINIDQERARVALSLKRLRPNPWETVERRYAPEQVVTALVTSIVPFGAFARLEEGLDGLIHVSEFNRPDGSPNPAVGLREGQQVQVRILHVDASRQRLGLSLKLSAEED
jgi:small subunit ribosomal protein S1